MDDKEYLVFSLFHRNPCTKFQQEEFVLRGGVLMDPPLVHTLSIPANVCFNFEEDKLESISVLSEEENHDKTIEDVVNTMLGYGCEGDT